MFFRTTKAAGTALCLCSLLFAGATPAWAQRAAWYSFDNATAADTSNNGHDGAIFGTPEPVPSPAQRGLKFDGQNDYIIVPDDADLQLAELTLSTWVRVDTDSVRDQWLIGKQAGTDGYKLSLLADRSVEFEARTTGEGSVRLTTPFPLPLKIWTHVAVSYDGRDAKLFVDGEPVDWEKTLDLSLSSGGDLTIAADVAPQQVSKLFRGALDEVIVFESPVIQSVLCRNAQKLWHRESHTCVSPFVDVAEMLGVADAEHGHFGICMVDINNDGWLDLYYANGADLVHPAVIPPSGACPDLGGPMEIDPGNYNTFFWNRGDGTFLPDSAPEMGIDDFWFAMQNVWGDYDNDGHRDLFSHNFMYSPLYHAVPGSDPLVFEDATAASDMVYCLRKGTGATWVDLNQDGWLDMFAVEYNTLHLEDDSRFFLYLNDGDGTFTEVTSESGMTDLNNATGITFADFDNDGDLDVFMCNSPPIPTRLYRNDGLDPETGIPHFTDVAPEAGLALFEGTELGMGVSWGDYNNDQLLDLLFLREEDSRLFMNNGPTAVTEEDGTTSGEAVWTFTDVTGVGGMDLFGDPFTDGSFADIDNDGWLDILTVGGMSNAGPNRVFLNNGDGTWREVASLLGMDFPHRIHFGVVPGDIDNDGDLDIAIASRNKGDPNYLFRNLTRGNNWVQFRLTGTISNRDAIGARIKVAAVIKPGGPVVMQTREVVAGTGFFSDIPRIQTIGLGKAPEILGATVRWPSGMVQDLGPLDVNMRHDITEPQD